MDLIFYLLYKVHTMFTFIKAVVAGVKSGYAAVIEEANGTTVTVYSSKVAQAAHVTAVKTVNAIRWFVQLCARAHNAIMSFAADHTVAAAIIYPAAIVAVGLCAGAVCTGTALIAAIITEIVATIYAASVIGLPFAKAASVGKTSFVAQAQAFCIGCLSVTFVMAYKALLITAFFALIA